MERDELVERLRAAGCVFAEDEARVLRESATSAAELVVLTDLRLSGLPLEHVVGWAELDGLRIEVDAGVFVPRQRSLRLVEEAVTLLHGRAERPLLVDLCCGSGAIGLAISTRLRQHSPTRVQPAELWAVDIDPVSVRCAARNLARVRGRAVIGDLYAALPDRLRGRFDLVVASPPYVPRRAIAAMPPEARLHEPRPALDGGRDGLDLVRRVLAGALGWRSRSPRTRSMPP